MGPVHREGSRQKKSKHDASSVWGVRMRLGRFVWLWKPSPLRGACFTFPWIFRQLLTSHNDWSLFPIAQPTITPELIEANEGDNATFNCSEIISQSQFTVEIMRPGDTGFSTLPISDPRLSVEEVGTTAVYTYGPVERDEDGSLLQCNLGGVPSISATLRVYCKFVTPVR